jgi:hypothetical protein
LEKTKQNTHTHTNEKRKLMREITRNIKEPKKKRKETECHLYLIHKTMQAGQVLKVDGAHIK